MILPPLYAIIDAQLLFARKLGLQEFASELREAGVSLLQYRHKGGSPQEVLADAAVLQTVFADGACTLVMNDRADLAMLAAFDGVHVGQDDLLPADARHVLWAGKIIGVSTHTDSEVAVADAGDSDYIAIGPVFATGTKPDAAAVVGLEGLRRARALTRKPLVAIGGITHANARSVIDAGADSVAVISALLPTGGGFEKAARDFLELLR